MSPAVVLIGRGLFRACVQKTAVVLVPLVVVLDGPWL